MISTECETEDCDTTVPLYPHDTFVSSDIPVELYYGDSRTGTHAFGTIGQDNVELAGLSLEDHYIASIHDTNTSVLDTSATGIFGLGFPVNRCVSTSWYNSILTNIAASSGLKHFSTLTPLGDDVETQHLRLHGVAEH